MTYGGPCHIEISTLICKGNQYIGLYMIGTSVRIELKLNEGRSAMCWDQRGTGNYGRLLFCTFLEHFPKRLKILFQKNNVNLIFYMYLI